MKEPIVLPIEPPVRSEVERVYGAIRRAILDGELRPDETVATVPLAKRLGVSRTPLREALRLLEREGLIVSERNRRARVASLSVQDLEQIYSLRITLENFGVRLASPMLTGSEIAACEANLEAMGEYAAVRNFEDYEKHHRAFHLGLVQHGGPWLIGAITQLSEYSERYRRVYLSRSRPWDSADEHGPILEAVINGEAAEAGRRLATHLARAALTLIAAEEPGRDPVPVRTALRAVLGDES